MLDFYNTPSLWKQRTSKAKDQYLRTSWGLGVHVRRQGMSGLYLLIILVAGREFHVLQVGRISV